jgi:large subunit ribosomal protein L27
MATKKSGGTAKNLRDSKPKYLGVKLYDGQLSKPGAVLVRQRGTRVLPGKNVRMGKDHTLFATIAGIVHFGNKRKIRFNGESTRKKVVNVLPQ